MCGSSIMNKIKLSYTGIGAMLKGDEMRQLVSDYGAQTALRAGDGYSYRVHNTGQRQAANVFPVTKEASNDNLANNTLLKAVK